MKRNLLIFALLMVASCDTINDCQHADVTISPASPIEFWPVDCDTYNERELCGVHPKCFCAPWTCDQEIKIPGIDNEGGNFNLQILDDQGDEITQVEFVNQESSFGNQMPDLDEFANEAGTGTNWTEGDTPSVTIIGIGSSDPLSVSHGLKAGKYRLDYTITFGSSMSMSLKFYKNGSVVETLNLIGFAAVSPLTDDVTFFLDEDIDEIEFNVLNGFAGSRTASIQSAELTRLTYSYVASFVPSELDICDQKIQLKILDVSASPDSVVLKSDCIDVRQTQPCTYLWDYSNNKDILGIVFEDVSPVLSLSIYVPMMFRLEEFPEEEEVMELTQSVEVLNSQIMEKKLAEIDYVPYYFHRKLKYILKFQFITIDGQSWVKGDEYKIIEGNKKWPVKMGEVWLTEKNSVQRAVL